MNEGSWTTEWMAAGGMITPGSFIVDGILGEFKSHTRL
jgi:hypothetical protein